MARELKNLIEGIEGIDLYPFCEDTFMWPSVNGNVLTNQIYIRSEKMHEVTRCK